MTEKEDQVGSEGEDGVVVCRDDVVTVGVTTNRGREEGEGGCRNWGVPFPPILQ